MPSGFSVQHFAKGAPINDSTPSTSTTYSSSKIDQKIASAGGGGSTTFLALTDTPASFSANQTVRANAAGNALEFYTPSAGVTSFLGLTDTPASFSANQTVRVNAAGNALEYYTPSAGASTFLGLSDTPASFTNGKLLYSTASGVELTTTQIAIDAGNIEVDQVNARQNDTTNIGDGTHRFNTVHCLALHQGSGKIVLPSSAGTAGQLLKIQSVNPSGDMILQFANESGGLSFTPNPITTALSRGDRTSTITVTASSGVHRTTGSNIPTRMVNGIHTLAGGTNLAEDYDTGTYGLDWNQNGYYQFDLGTAYAINEFILYYSSQGTNFWGYSNADKLDDVVFRIFGSNDASTWTALNANDYNFYSQVTTGAWNYHETYGQFNVICGKIALTTNMGNYRHYRIQLLNEKIANVFFSEIEFAYKKRYEVEYT